MAVCVSISAVMFCSHLTQQQLRFLLSVEDIDSINVYAVNLLYIDTTVKRNSRFLLVQCGQT